MFYAKNLLTFMVNYRKLRQQQILPFAAGRATALAVFHN